MADRDTANLCVEIVHHHFGPLVAKVVDVLLVRGRLSLLQLVRFSLLKPRTARACVLVLVQQNVLWHATEDDTEVFEVNVEECLMRSRFGQFVSQAESLLGHEASQIVSLILTHGKLKSQDITRLLPHEKKAGVYAQSLYKLVSMSYLKPATILAHKSPRDKIIEYEKEEKSKLSGIPSAKDLRAARETAEVRVKREEEDAEKIGLKRKAKDGGVKTSKRVKASVDEMVDPDVYFRVNYDKFNVLIRNKIISSAAGERFNDGASQVMHALLKSTEAKQKNVRDVRSDPTGLADILRYIPDEGSLPTGLILSSKRPKLLEVVQQYLHMLSFHDNNTQSGMTSRFLTIIGKKVQVEFDTIGTRLRQRVLEAVARERHGDAGVRILRMLLSSGKMDEKQISKVAMMAPKDVRPLLSVMSSESLISLQEVPRTTDRNPTRTFYLWYVDLPKANTVLLGNLYKTLYNIYARRRAEGEASLIKAVLSKLDREDVTEDNLTRTERELLVDWRLKREKLTVLEMRVQESVFILRDLATRTAD